MEGTLPKGRPVEEWSWPSARPQRRKSRGRQVKRVHGVLNDKEEVVRGEYDAIVTRRAGCAITGWRFRG